METRRADAADADAVTATIALAFRDDPVWGPALSATDGRTDQLEQQLSETAEALNQSNERLQRHIADQESSK